MKSPDSKKPTKQYQLIGTEVSLYTGKVRAYLRFKNIPFEEVLSTGEVYKNIIIPRTGVRFIPVVITDDDIVIQDTTDIIDFCEARFPDPSVYPSSPKQRLVALLLEIYGDEWLVNPAMYYRWSYPQNREFAIQEFGRTNAPNKSKEEQKVIGEKLAAPFAGALPRLGITAANARAVEKSYTEFLTDLNTHLGRYPYLLGHRPSIGDFGFIGPLYAHLFRDPYSGELMKKKAPNVARWVQRVHEGQSTEGNFLSNDEVPETLLPLLKRMFTEQVPVIQSTINHLQQWVEENNVSEIPRVIGSHRYRLGDVEEERLVFPYNLWMWQRAYDCYQQLDQEAKASVNELFAPIPNAVEALRYPMPNRLKRTNNQLQLK